MLKHQNDRFLVVFYAFVTVLSMDENDLDIRQWQAYKDTDAICKIKKKAQGKFLGRKEILRRSLICLITVNLTALWSIFCLKNVAKAELNTFWAAFVCQATCHKYRNADVMHRWYWCGCLLSVNQKKTPTNFVSVKAKGVIDVCCRYDWIATSVGDGVALDKLIRLERRAVFKPTANAWPFYRLIFYLKSVLCICL